MAFPAGTGEVICRMYTWCCPMICIPFADIGMLEELDSYIQRDEFTVKTILHRH